MYFVFVSRGKLASGGVKLSCSTKEIKLLLLLLLLSIISLRVYIIIINGWSSNSIYSILGAIRSIAQTISYEVRIILIILRNVLFIERFNLINLINYQFYLNFIIYLYPLILIFLIRLIAELNRTPFDLSEGESELVSGFNTEYIRGGFALIFISEYGIIIFIRYIIVLFYIGNFNIKFLFYIKILIIINLIIIFRGTFPRYRYDNLILLIWKRFLPIILNLIIYLYLIKWLIIIYFN